MTDYKNAGGVCGNGGIYGSAGNWPASSTPCTFASIDYATSVNFNISPSEVDGGLCTQETEEALKSQECINDVWRQRPDILFQIRHLVRLMCNYKVYIGFRPKEQSSRLNPVNEINAYYDSMANSNVTLTTKLDFENTRHRYSWICSIRDPLSGFHFCSATLLGNNIT